LQPTVATEKEVVAGRTRKKVDAINLGNEVETLVGKGPYGGCIPRKYVREVLAIYSTLIPRKVVKTQIILEEVL
jgi:hypothetical protein